MSNWGPFIAMGNSLDSYQMAYYNEVPTFNVLATKVPIDGWSYV